MILWPFTPEIERSFLMLSTGPSLPPGFDLEGPAGGSRRRHLSGGVRENSVSSPASDSMLHTIFIRIHHSRRIGSAQMDAADAVDACGTLVKSGVPLSRWAQNIREFALLCPAIPPTLTHTSPLDLIRSLTDALCEAVEPLVLLAASSSPAGPFAPLMGSPSSHESAPPSASHSSPERQLESPIFSSHDRQMQHQKPRPQRLPQRASESLPPAAGTLGAEDDGRQLGGTAELLTRLAWVLATSHGPRPRRPFTAMMAQVVGSVGAGGAEEG